MNRLPPLSPTGTARAWFQGPGAGADDDELLPRELRAALATHDVGEGHLWAAWEAAGWAAGASIPERRALVCLVIALLEAIDAGGTCLPLCEPAPVVAALAAVPPPALPDGLLDILSRIGLPEGDRRAAESLAARMASGAAPAAIAALMTSVPAPAPGAPADLSSSPGARRPFVLSAGALYPERLWALEARVVSWLRPRLIAPIPQLAPPASLDAALREIGSDAGARALSDQQVAAIRAAVIQPLTLIAGGPGTGKTSAVVTLLRVLVRLGVAPAQITLGAPTGRAAQRMKEALDLTLAGLSAPAAPDRLLAAHPAGATTLHRLLGIRPGTHRPLEPSTAEYTADWPLPQRVVIVDEASMIDLDLMDRLGAALAPDARLILVGDEDQLPAVQVGAVFRDLVAAAPEVTCRLTRSLRMNPNDPAGAAILRVAAAINVGAVEPASLPLRGGPADLTFAGIERMDEGSLDGFLDRWHGEVLAAEQRLDLALDRRYAIAGTALDAGQEQVRQVLETLTRSRILCVTRTAGRTTSAAAVNAALHARYQAAAFARGADDGLAGATFIPGEPVMVVRNDPTRGLANGDQGVILRVHGARGDTLAVAFAREAGIVVQPLDALRADLTLAFAVTVHKAQGSEYDRIALVLPDRDVPLLTREILYTALTRARGGVVVIGDVGLFVEAARRVMRRTSGLPAKLRA